MPDAPEPTETEDEDLDGNNPVAVLPPEEKSVSTVKPSVAADFVDVDTDRPKADENAAPPLLPPISTEEPRRKNGRPRVANPSKEALRSRERYARMKAERTLPPSFSDLPGGTAPAGEGAPVSPPPIPGKTVDYKLNAGLCFDMATGALSMLLSDEWKPQNEGEREQMVTTLARYMEYKNWSDLTPGWALAVVGSFYVLPRLSMPKTKEKLSKIMKKLKREENEDMHHVSRL